MRDAADEPGAEAASRRRILLLTIGIAAGVLVVALAGAALWIGSRALEARDSLTRAQALIGELRTSAVEDPDGAPALAARIAGETAQARSATNGAVWRMAEHVPWAGRNLAVVRELAEVVDDVADDALVPLAGAASELDLEALAPESGRFDLAPLTEAGAAVAAADDALQRAVARVQAIDDAGVVGEISTARSQLLVSLEEAGGALAAARPVTDLLPGMLGAEGPRSYLLVFQNNAEARSLGGNAASFLALTVDGGALHVTRQASSQDFPRDADPPIALEPHLTELYYPAFPRYVMDIATRPDFPTMARLAKGWWEREFGQHIDVVVSFDPVALASLLDATGPIALPTGETLTADNAVSLLLSEAYARYPDPDASDAFFTAAAGAIFATLTTGDVQPGPLVEAVTAAAEERRLLAWSERPEEQELILTLPLAGVLPAGNEDSTTVGVYFNDQSASKIDYWVDSSVAVIDDRCTAPDAPTFSVTWTLTSRLTREQAATLPDYVLSGWWGAEKFRTDVYVLGPPGTTLAGVEVVTPGLSNDVLASGTDLARPIVRLATDVATGGTTSVTVHFQGGAQSYGALAVQTTPMVNPTLVTAETPACR